jgi:hypothetical protein
VRVGYLSHILSLLEPTRGVRVHWWSRGLTPGNLSRHPYVSGDDRPILGRSRDESAETGVSGI